MKRILVACEYSGVVRDAFKEIGWDAWSCDLLPTDVPGQHIQGDVMPLLKEPWDMIIGFPPCTYLCASGMHWTHRGYRDQQQTEDALAFVAAIMSANSHKIAVENPIGCISSRIRKPDQIIQHYHFGHPESKATCLWLKGILKLRKTNVLKRHPGSVWNNQTASGQNNLWGEKDRWKIRAKTYTGIGKSMASQWGRDEFVLCND